MATPKRGRHAQVTDYEKARIVALRGLNFTHREISEASGRSHTTVSRVLNDHERAARDAADPLNVFAEAVEDLLVVRVEVADEIGDHNAPTVGGGE